MKKREWNKRSICCPRTGMRGFVMYDGKLRECEIVGGAVMIGDGHGTISHMLDLSVAGVDGVLTCGSDRFPRIYATEDDYKNGKQSSPFRATPSVVVLEKIFGKCTWSSDKPWSVTRFRKDGAHKRFDLDGKIIFDKEGTRLSEMPDFGDYTARTMSECVGRSRKDAVEVVRMKPGQIDFREVS